ncbi:hypothetical protein JOJ86_006033 [Rhodococcus percolatus]|uniref:hypothetical protein n=1 Tax=Rhodococcus opacus TaxID=37919 RepID=UPI0015FDB1D9|nr:hypothetical protein [Rhodococcus opacus]MBA8964755.1 hypothetical protein [Rhodococcus opacus]MBP2208307.1 hypothetical protein [Rhodococcus opacus]
MTRRTYPGNVRDLPWFGQKIIRDLREENASLRVTIRQRLQKEVPYMSHASRVAVRDALEDLQPDIAGARKAAETGDLNAIRGWLDLIDGVVQNRLHELYKPEQEKS